MNPLKPLLALCIVIAAVAAEQKLTLIDDPHLETPTPFIIPKDGDWKPTAWVFPGLTVNVAEKSTNLMEFRDANNVLNLAIALNGQVTMAKGMTQDRASRVFWTNIANAFPFVKQHLVEEGLGIRKDDLVTILNGVSQLLQPSTNAMPLVVDTMPTYMPPRAPAERLREQAAEIERRDAVIAQFRVILKQIGGRP